MKWLKAGIWSEHNSRTFYPKWRDLPAKAFAHSAWRNISEANCLPRFMRILPMAGEAMFNLRGKAIAERMRLASRVDQRKPTEISSTLFGRSEAVEAFLESQDGSCVQGFLEELFLQSFGSCCAKFCSALRESLEMKRRGRRLGVFRSKLADQQLSRMGPGKFIAALTFLRGV